MPLDYAPDADIKTPGLIRRLSNFVPTPYNTYTPAPAPLIESYATPLANSDVVGSALIKNAAGGQILYAGTTGKLWKAGGVATFLDVSGAAYTTGGNTWSFAQYSNQTIAANGADNMQVSTGGNFSNLSASAPSAKIVVIHENAAVAFNTVSAPDGWYRSDTGDVTNWTASAANDVDTGNLRGVGGQIVAATVYGPLVLAWKTNAMYAGLFAGGAGGALDPKIRWDFVPGGTGVGCVAQHAHIETEIGVIFVSDRDIMVFDGGRPRSITANKVRNYFYRFFVSRNQCFITHNEIERNIFIWYAISGTFPTRALVFNYDTGHWGELSTVSTALTAYDYVRCPVRGVNYTDYTSVGGIIPNSGLEANVVWLSPHAGTGAVLANFAASKQQIPATGPQMVTGVWGNAQQDSTWTKILQIGGTNGTPTISSGILGVYPNSTLSAPASVTGAVGPDGQLDVVANGRYMSATINWAASGTVHEVSDLVPQQTPAGKR
jgi:hypothetical protein